MSVVKNQGEKEIKKALLDPNYPRTIRIVMNRGLSIDKYTAAIIEALEPRMKGQELNSLEEFKKLNPPVDLIEGAEMEMTIRGDTLLYKNAVGGEYFIAGVFIRLLHCLHLKIFLVTQRSHFLLKSRDWTDQKWGLYKCPV